MSAFTEGKGKVLEVSGLGGTSWELTALPHPLIINSMDPSAA